MQILAGRVAGRGEKFDHGATGFGRESRDGGETGVKLPGDPGVPGHPTPVGRGGGDQRLPGES